MKARHIILVGMVLLLTPLLLAADEILLNQLPAAARHTLDRIDKRDPVKRITRQVDDGRTIYLVELERDNAINPRLRIAETGELLPELPVPALDPTAPVPVTANAVISLGNLPLAVQQTVRIEAAGREIAGVDAKTWQGQAAYEIEFRAPGRNQKIMVTEAGTLVPPAVARGRIVGPVQGAPITDLPPVVQDTIRREAAGRPVTDVEIERRTGNVVYDVEIREPQSGTFQLQVDAKGRIVKDSRPAAPEPKP